MKELDVVWWVLNNNLVFKYDQVLEYPNDNNDVSYVKPKFVEVQNAKTDNPYYSIMTRDEYVKHILSMSQAYYDNVYLFENLPIGTKILACSHYTRDANIEHGVLLTRKEVGLVRNDGTFFDTKNIKYNSFYVLESAPGYTFYMNESYKIYTGEVYEWGGEYGDVFVKVSDHTYYNYCNDRHGYLTEKNASYNMTHETSDVFVKIKPLQVNDLITINGYTLSVVYVDDSVILCLGSVDESNSNTHTLITKRPDRHVSSTDFSDIKHLINIKRRAREELSHD